MTETPTGKFTTRPVHNLISNEFAPEIIRNIECALDWFVHHGVRHTREVVVPDSPPFFSIAQAGVVVWVPGKLTETPNSKVNGETRLSHTVGGDILGAEITLDNCTALAAAHEFGHALGLVHSVHRWNLMSADTSEVEWQLTREQQLWIAEP